MTLDDLHEDGGGPPGAAATGAVLVVVLDVVAVARQPGCARTQPLVRLHDWVAASRHVTMFRGALRLGMGSCSKRSASACGRSFRARSRLHSAIRLPLDPLVNGWSCMSAERSCG